MPIGAVSNRSCRDTRPSCEFLRSYRKVPLLGRVTPLARPVAVSDPHLPSRARELALEPLQVSRVWYQDKRRAFVRKVALGNLWAHIWDMEHEVRIAACVHDEILLVVKAEKAEIYSQLLKNCMESALAKWLGPIPSVADVKVGDSWDETH